MNKKNKWVPSFSPVLAHNDIGIMTVLYDGLLPPASGKEGDPFDGASEKQDVYCHSFE